MRQCQPFHPRHRLIHPRIVLHRAGAQRVQPGIHPVIPGGKPGKVADDFNLAHFRHVAEILSFGWTQELCRVDFRHVERRQLPGGLARPRFFEDESLVLADVTGGFAGHVLHRATSWMSLRTSASFMARVELSLSATRPTAVSIAVRVVISVQHQSAALPNSG